MLPQLSRIRRILSVLSLVASSSMSEVRSSNCRSGTPPDRRDLGLSCCSVVNKSTQGERRPCCLAMFKSSSSSSSSVFSKWPK